MLIDIHTFSFKNAFENVVWKVVAILSRPQGVKPMEPEVDTDLLISYLRRFIQASRVSLSFLLMVYVAI